MMSKVKPRPAAKGGGTSPAIGMKGQSAKHKAGC